MDGSIYSYIVYPETSNAFLWFWKASLLRFSCGMASVAPFQFRDHSTKQSHQHLHQLVWLCSHTTLTKAGWRQAGRWRPAFVEKEGMLQIQRKNLQTQCSCPENSLGIKGSNKNVLLKSPAQTPSVDRGILSPYYPGLITPLFWGVSQALKDAYQHLWSLLSRY